MRITSTFTLVSACSLAFAGLGACGDDGGSGMPVDAAVKDIGFNKPTAPLKANDEQGADNWVELGPADLSCINTPDDAPIAANEITINTRVEQFNPAGQLAPNVTVTVFADQDLGTPFGPAVMSDMNAELTVTIPAGTKRFGYKMVHPDALDTLLFNQTLADGATTPQTLSQIQIVSTATAAILPGLIGVSRTPGTGVLAGAVRDCADHELSNFIATVSSTPGTVTHVEGVDTYYFSSSVGLPVRHTQQAVANKDGLFMAIEMNPTPTAYVQVWGYPTDADLAADNLTLIAELETQVIAETVITGSYEPLRTP